LGTDRTETAAVISGYYLIMCHAADLLRHSQALCLNERLTLHE